jgi:PAS domain S-box-containing protein
MASPSEPPPAAPDDVGALIRRVAWEGTALGPPERWPRALRTIVELMVHSKFPMFVAWGAELTFLYNQAYAPILGARHPSAFARPFRSVWSEIWPDLAPLVERALAGEGSWLEDMPLLMRRNGFDEQTFFTFSYSPARDDDGTVQGVFCACTETTAKVLAVREMAAERERLTEMFARAPAFMALLGGPDHRFELVNAAYHQLLGFRDVIGRPAREAVPEVEGQGFFELLDGVYASGEPFIGRQLPLRLRRTPDAEVGIAYLDFVYQPVRDGAGRVSGIFVTGYDVTDLKQAEDRLRLAQQAGGLGAFELYPATRTLAVTEDFCRIWGVPYRPVLPLDETLAAIHPDDRHLVLTGRREIDADALGNIEYRILRPDTGEERWIARRGEAIRDGELGMIRFAGVIYDVTDRRRADDALRESEARQSQLLQQLNEALAAQVAERTAERDRMWRLSQDLFVVLTATGTIAAINPAVASLGYTPEDLAGRAFLDFVHDADATMLAGLSQARTQPMRDVETRLRAADGTWRWFAWSAVPSEGLIHAVGRDVTEERRRAAELQQVQEALRQSQKLEAMGQLTGGVAHDFNNLLTPIIGSLDMLLRRGGGSEREQRLLHGALQSADRAKTLVQRLLAFARRQPLQPRPVDLAQLVEGMGELIASTSGPRIRLVIDLAPGLPCIAADPNQLEMAILNLAVNSRDAMPEGGQLTIAAKVRIVRDGQEPVAAGEYVQLCVSDTGVGMDDATAARAVEPFFSTKGIGRGTGLGLSMVHGLALQLKGALHIRSRRGLGTTIELLFPVARAAADDAPEAAPEPRLQRVGRALLVDDEEAVRASTADMLVDLGYDVEEFGSAEEALARLVEGPVPALVVTDHLMPGMTGADFARHVQERMPQVPVLLISGYAEHQGVPLDLPRLTKPFRQAELAGALEELTAG